MHQIYRVMTNRQENDRTTTLVLDRFIDAQPGQFVMIWLPGSGEKPYCVTNNHPLTLTVVQVGPFSRALCDRQSGDPVWVRGPFGHGYQLLGERLCLVGGGYGVASLLFLARRAVAEYRHVDVCIGAQKAEDVLLLASFKELGLHPTVTTEDGSLGYTGLVTGLVDALLREHPPDWLYACGPPAMLEAVSAQCRTHRCSHQLSWEAHIRCGLGLCGSCECSIENPNFPAGWLVCQDGPVQIVKYE